MLEAVNTAIIKAVETLNLRRGSILVELSGFKAECSISLKEIIQNKDLSLVWIDKNPIDFYLSLNPEKGDLSLEEKEREVRECLEESRRSIGVDTSIIIGDKGNIKELINNLEERFGSLESATKERDILLILDCCNRETLETFRRRVKKRYPQGLPKGFKIVLGFSYRNRKGALSVPYYNLLFIRDLLGPKATQVGSFDFKQRGGGGRRGFSSYIRT